MQRPSGGLFERQLSMTRAKRRLDPVVDCEDKVILPVIKVVHLLSSSHLSGTPAVLQSGRLLSTEPNRVDEPFKVRKLRLLKCRLLSQRSCLYWVGTALSVRMSAERLWSGVCVFLALAEEPSERTGLHRFAGREWRVHFGLRRR